MIKINMEMPDCCMKCSFYNGYLRGTCVASPYYDLDFGDTYADMERHKDCPLEEVEDDE